MAYVLLIFVLFSPLLGIVMMENGAIGPSLWKTGYPNGAAVAYVCHLIFFFIGFKLIGKTKITFAHKLSFSVELINWRKAPLFITLFNILAFLFTYFLLGGIYTILGVVGKGEFRVSLGIFGAIAYLLIKVFCPVILAFLAHLVLYNPKNKLLKRYFIFNLALVFLTGLGWGFKTTSIMMLMPAFIIIAWKLKFLRLLKFAVILFVTLVGTAILFDGNDKSTVELLTFILTRLTVIQGDVSWYFWGEVSNGLKMNYANTLMPIFGDRIFSLVSGLSKSNYEIWILYHYDLLITYMTGYPLEGIEEGHTITGTIFSEGLFIFGKYYFVLFSLFAGVFTGYLIKVIKYSLLKNNLIISSLFSTYFVFNVFPWLNGGGVVTLFHISSLLGFVLSFIFLKVVCRLVISK